MRFAVAHHVIKAWLERGCFLFGVASADLLGAL